MNKVKLHIRSFRMKLFTTDFYWRTRHKLRVLWFKVLNSQYRLMVVVETKKNDFEVSRTILLGGFVAILTALVIFIISEYSSNFVKFMWPSLHAATSNIVDNLFKILSIEIKTSDDAITGLLGAVTGVAGVFLGLYFTAISIGAGQQLGSFHLSIRNLVVEEKFGTKYIKSLTVLTLFSFFLWLKMALTGEITDLSLVILISYSIYIIAGFYPLGKRSFFLAEPRMLAIPIFHKTLMYLQRLSRRDLLSSHPSFEDFFRKEVKSNIETIRQLMELSLERLDKGILDSELIVHNLTHVLKTYRAFKQDIPTDSKWFEVVPKHDNWLMPDSTKEQMLHNLGIISQPPTVPDRDWLEKDINAIIELCLNTYATQKSFTGFIAILDIVRPFLKNLAYEWSLEEARTLYEVCRKSSMPMVSDLSGDFQLRIGLTDRLGLMKIEIAVEVLKCTNDFNSALSLKRLTDFTKLVVKRPRMAIPSKVRITIDELMKMMVFEKDVENEIASPDWYISQIIARTFAKEVKSNYSSLVDFIQIDSSTADNYTEAVIVALERQREIELSIRLDGMRSDFAAKVKELKTMQKIADLEIESFPEDFREIDIERLRGNQMNVIAGILIRLFKPSRDDSFPDFFGTCYRQLLVETFHRLEQNNLEGFKELFPKLLLGALFAKDRLASDFLNHNNENEKFKILIDPLLDVLHLSGYAIAYSEIHNEKGFADCVLRQWKKIDNVLVTLDTIEKTTNWIISIHGLHTADLLFSPMSHLRFSWKQSFENKLREEKYIHDHRFGSYERNHIKVGKQFPFLRAITRGGYPPNEEPTEWLIAKLILAEGLKPESLELSHVNFWKDYNWTINEDDENEDGEL